jgi:hypothetical protein
VADTAPTPAPTAPASAAAAVTSTHLLAAVIAGLAAAVAGAALWALVTVTTRFQIGFMAVAVGLLVGWAVQRSGRSGAPILGVVGAACALLGCALGNLLSAAGFAAQNDPASLGKAVAAVLTNPALDVAILSRSFSAVQLVFYAIAVYEGYKFARRPIAG